MIHPLTLDTIKSKHVSPLAPFRSLATGNRGTLGLRSLQEALHGDISQPMPRPVAQFWLQMLVWGRFGWG